MKNMEQNTPGSLLGFRRLVNSLLRFLLIQEMKS